MLSEMFYSRDEFLSEWEFLPPVGPRPQQGFVGLKNAGATCYMNSVLQQLFMLRGIKEGVLSCEEACADPDEDFSGEEKLELDTENEDEDKGDYNLTILKQVQAIFEYSATSPPPSSSTTFLGGCGDTSGCSANRYVNEQVCLTLG